MASRSLGTLTAELILKMGGLTQGMDKAARDTANFEKKISSNFRAAGESFKRLAGIVGIGLGLEGLRRAGADAIEFGDNIKNATEKTGIGAEKLTELAYAAQQTNVPFDELTTSLKKMQVALSEAASGSKAPNDTLAALGLTIEQLKQLKPDQQFEVLADRIAALKDPADRARAAVDLFGKAGADLLPLFADGAEGIRKFEEEAHRVNATLNGEQIQSLAAANKSINELKASFVGLARTLTADVAPSLSQFLNNINAVVNNDAIGKLKEQIDFLRREQGHSFIAVDYGKIGTGFFTAAEGAAKLVELEKELNDLEGKRQSRIAPGGHDRTPFAPGFTPEVPRGPRVDPAPWLQEVKVTAQQLGPSALEQVYAEWDKATETELKGQIDDYIQFIAQVNQLLADGIISPAEAMARKSEKLDDFLPEIQVTAEKIFPKQERSKLSVFWEQAARNSQDLFAEFLYDPFKDGLKGMLEGFADMLRRMAAQAVAADIAGKIFGSAAGGSGQGLLGLFLSAAGSYFGDGLSPVTVTAQKIPGYAGGGYTGSGGKYQPAGIVHAGEGVLSQSDISAIGGPGGFMNLLGVIRNGYADGGLVTSAGRFGSVNRFPATSSHDNSKSITLTQNFVLPTGGASKATQQQIGAEAYRGALRAAARNT